MRALHDTLRRLAAAAERASRTGLAALCATALFSFAPPAAMAGPIDLGGVGGPFTVQSASIKSNKFRAMVRQQYDFSCGSAAVATLLSYHYGVPTTEQTAFEEMFAYGDQEKIKVEGFSLLDMKRFLASRGFNADGFELPLEKLEEANVPAIVLVTDSGYNHFVVIKGMGDGRVLLGDPARGVRVMTRADFDLIWKNRLLFVIHNEQSLAIFNSKADWVAVPRAPLSTGVVRDGLQNITIPRFGVGEL